LGEPLFSNPKSETYWNISDEILYHAKLHPEQYSDTFSSAQLKQLHTSILYVCQTAVDLLADSSKFPEDWLFKHRWGKGKKDSVSTLPNGAKITFLTVGGRTSCVVPSVQKKTGAVAGDVKKEVADEAENGDEKPATKKAGKSNGTKKRKDVPKAEELEAKDQLNGTSKKRKAATNVASETSKKTSKVKDETVEALSQGRRRSGRASKSKV
jgi:formamidopyrimidine-DNA glycosylase